MKKQHGGRRPNQTGRPRHDPAGTKRRYTIWLTPSEVAYLEALAGTAPDGLRRLLAASMAATSRRTP